MTGTREELFDFLTINKSSFAKDFFVKEIGLFEMKKAVRHILRDLEEGR